MESLFRDDGAADAGANWRSVEWDYLTRVRRAIPIAASTSAPALPSTTMFFPRLFLITSTYDLRQITVLTLDICGWKTERE